MNPKVYPLRRETKNLDIVMPAYKLLCMFFELRSINKFDYKGEVSSDTTSAEMLNSPTEGPSTSSPPSAKRKRKSLKELITF